MRILFNGHWDLIPQNGNNICYGGILGFTRTFADYIAKQTSHTFIGLAVKGDKQLKNKAKVEVFREGRHSWVVFSTATFVKQFIMAKKSAIPKQTLRVVKDLSAVLQELKPDVVLLAGFPIGNWYLLRAAKMAGIPVAVSHHGLWFKDIESAADRFTPFGIRLTRLMEKDIVRLADKEIFLNEFSLREFGKKLAKVPRSKAVIIPLPYNPVYLKGAARPPKRGGILKIGLVGRWDKIKNHEAFLSLALEAKKQGLPWKFYSVTYLAGQRAMPELKAEYQKHIAIVPQMPAGQLKNFYRKMDLMVMPSYFDVSPTVVMEAALQNRGTIISPNVGWVSAYRKLGMKKWITDFKDIRQTVRLVRNLAARPLPKKAVNYIRASHDPDKIFGRHIRLLESLIPKK